MYNHYNVIKLSKSEIKYYYKNLKYLKKFKNSINFFSYPFGQKNENYNNSTDKYILNILKSKKIFMQIHSHLIKILHSQFTE